jgi:hypothetical protein
MVKFLILIFTPQTKLVEDFLHKTGRCSIDFIIPSSTLIKIERPIVLSKTLLRNSVQISVQKYFAKILPESSTDAETLPDSFDVVQAQITRNENLIKAIQTSIDQTNKLLELNLSPKLQLILLKRIRRHFKRYQKILKICSSFTNQIKDKLLQDPNF